MAGCLQMLPAHGESVYTKYTRIYSGTAYLEREAEQSDDAHERDNGYALCKPGGRRHARQRSRLAQ